MQKVFATMIYDRRPDGSVGMALVLPALTDCWWWFESLRESQVRPAERQRAPTTKKIATMIYDR